MDSKDSSGDNFDEIEKFPEVRKELVDGVFVDFSPEGAMQKLIHLDDFVFNERMTYTKHLADLLDLIGEPIADHLKDILNHMVQDTDDIKRTLLLQLPYVIQNLLKLKSGYSLLRDILISVLFTLIGNENIDIKEEAGKILAKIGDIMDENDRGEFILTKVLAMAHDDNVDDNRIVAIQLLTQMAHCFGKDLCDQFVGLEILSLGEDPQLRVRKESVTNLPVIGNNVTSNFFLQRLLPFFIRKSQDSIWGIRKACVEILVEISNLCTPKVKENELTEILLTFLKDNSKWVKVAAFKNLGPFIVTLKDCKPSEKLFEHYTKMIDSTVSTLSNENEILISCAQYFPAILQVYGEKKWPQLQKTFAFFLKSNIKKVKKPIACSLHEIAIIIGSDKAERDLFNVLDQILNDTNDEVKHGAIQHLAYFIEVFDSQKRENLLEVLLNVQKDQRKWRVRELIANQIGILAKMFSSETVSRYIVPISFKLCNDTVAYVREEAAKNVHLILLELAKEESSEEHLQMCVNHIRAFSISNRYNQRQTFILMCGQLLKHEEIFKKHFLDTFEILSTDKVVNVRIVLAKTIAEYLKKQNNDNILHNDDKFRRIISILSTDKSRDVRIYFTEVQDYVQEKKNPIPIQPLVAATQQLLHKPAQQPQQQIEDNDTTSQSEVLPTLEKLETVQQEILATNDKAITQEEVETEVNSTVITTELPSNEGINNNPTKTEDLEKESNLLEQTEDNSVQELNESIESTGSLLKED